MLTDNQFRELIRRAILDRLEQLRNEYVHWLNELKKLDDLASVQVDETQPAEAKESNVIPMSRPS